MSHEPDKSVSLKDGEGLVFEEMSTRYYGGLEPAQFTWTEVAGPVVFTYRHPWYIRLRDRFWPPAKRRKVEHLKRSIELLKKRIAANVDRELYE